MTRQSEVRVKADVERANRRLDKAEQEEKTPRQQRFLEADKERKSKLKAFKADNVSEPGAIPNLPPLLESRRLDYSIPDAFFRTHPCNNRINVFQLDNDEGDTYGDGLIVKADAAIDRSLQQAPKGILLGGGLKAMDHMYANGYWVGHIINFCQSNPWRMPLGIFGGKRLYVQVMTCGDVSDSDDLAMYLRAGLVKHVRREYKIISDDGTEASAVEHYLQDTQTGEVWDPSAAKMLEEEAGE